MLGRPAIFAIDASRQLGERIAEESGIALSRHEEREFEDGEHKIRPLADVQGCDVFVVQSLYSDARQSVNDKLIRLLVFLGALRDAGAARLTAVVPYLAYARKDKRTQAHDPITTRYVAQILEALGLDVVMTLDVHNLAAFENAFRIQSLPLEAGEIFAAHFASALVSQEKVSVISPDAGGLKRAGRFRGELERALGREVHIGFMEKTREHGELSAGQLHGDVADATVIIIDDMISTGGTLALAAGRARELGARRVFAAASHGVFVGNAAQTLDSEAIDRVIITDSVSPVRLPAALVERKLTFISCAPLFAAAIQRLAGAVTRR